MSEFAALWVGAGFLFGMGLGFYQGLTAIMKLMTDNIYRFWYGRSFP